MGNPFAFSLTAVSMITVSTSGVYGVATAQPVQPMVPSSPRIVSQPAWKKDPRFMVAVSFSTPLKKAPEPLLLHGLAHPDDGLEPADLQPVRVPDSYLLTVKDALHFISRATRVRVLAQGSISRSLVAVPRSGVSARDLMESLSQQFRSVWVQHGEGWVLLQFTGYLPIVVLSAEERDKQRADCVRKLVSALQPSQWDALGRDGYLPVRLLAPEQQRLVRELLRLDFLDPDRGREGAPIEEGQALGGKDVRLRLIGSGRQTRFGLECRRADGHPYLTTTPFYHPATGELTWGVPPPK